MLDVLSGGRLVAGFPVGTPMDTTFAYGETPATLREKYREGVELILKAWQAEEPFVFNGKYTQLRYVNVWPRPIQKPYPPVWIPRRQRRDVKWCAITIPLAYLSYFVYNARRQVIDVYSEAVDEVGVDPNPYRAASSIRRGVEGRFHAEELYARAPLTLQRAHLYPASPTLPATPRCDYEEGSSAGPGLRPRRWPTLRGADRRRCYVVSGSPIPCPTPDYMAYT